MQHDIHHNIQNLKDDILHIEDNFNEFSKLNYSQGIKESLHQLESNLKYLSILANGAPIDKDEDRHIMDFLRTHYDYLHKLQTRS